MKLSTFNSLCELLTINGLLQPSKNMSVREQVIIFLQIIGHNARFRFVAGKFHRSVETVHRYFRVVLKSILKLYKHLVGDPESSTPPEILNNPRFYLYFNDCVGAIDETHIQASVPIEVQGKFHDRKDSTTQNVLAAITFDLKFTYVLAGWEGSEHDSRVLNDVLSRPRGLKINEGKYYLGDAGYGTRNEIICPYHGVRYHLREFTDHPPENEKELFNLRHSSSQTTTKRGFGILKKLFRAIDSKPQWSYGTQVDLVLASCILHNHIMGAINENIPPRS
ncbi:hypothetical protein DITRI_Ditri02bG0100600 [Diplodiscus trichospermus]